MNEVEKEIVKAAGATGAAFIGGPVAATIAASLGVAVEMFGTLSQKRSSELFNSDEYVHKVISKIEESDDFASFVYDIWIKHNFESSEQRRKYLRNMLKKETYDSTNRFVNFSKIEHILQNASIESLRLATYIYSKDFSERECDPQDAGMRLVNYQKLSSLLEGTKYDDLRIDIELYVNELSALGIIDVRHNRYSGPLYTEHHSVISSLNILTKNREGLSALSNLLIYMRISANMISTAPRLGFVPVEVFGIMEYI